MNAEHLQKDFLTDLEEQIAIKNYIQSMQSIYKKINLYTLLRSFEIFILC